MMRRISMKHTPLKQDLRSDKTGPAGWMRIVWEARGALGKIRCVEWSSERLVENHKCKSRFPSGMTNQRGDSHEGDQGSLAASAMGSQWSGPDLGPARNVCGRYCLASAGGRSEEHRAGKEGRSRW